MALNQIGRFKVGKKIGSGAQGSVYLCGDSELQRRVAIKLLNKSVLGSDSIGQAFQREARTMSKIQHPNIVSIYEAGRHEGVPFLVFEYVEGHLLSELIGSGNLTVSRALDILQGMLEGLDQAHKRGIVHRDLKPGNVIVGEDRVPKIMDFGIASVISSPEINDDQLIGSPRYMAPEYITEGRVGPEGDVFSLGLILDEMLTGMPVFKGKDQQAVLDSIVKDDVPAPSTFNEEVDERLDRLVLKTLEKDPSARFANAGDLLSALKEYRGSGKQVPEAQQESSGTIEFILRRMRRQSDFPALSRSIRTLNAMAASSDKDASDMAGVIVNDFALASKILKVVNSAYYGRFAGKIGTISRAAVVLGVQPIRSIAASLIFFEHLSNKAQAEELREQVSAALLSALMASRMADELDADDREKCFLCAMLHNLGRVLVIFYLHEESREIKRLIDQEGVDPRQAQRTVLGASFEEIGIGIARQWNFPSSITDSMRDLPEGKVKRARTLDEQYRQIACFSNETVQALVASQGWEPRDLDPLAKRFGDCLNIGGKKYEELVNGATKEFVELNTSLAGGGQQAGFIQKIQSRKTGSPAINAKPGSAADSAVPVGGDPQAVSPVDQASILVDRDTAPEDAEGLLSDGLQEVTGMLVGEHSLTQVFNVVLETMYRAMAFQRVVLCLRDMSRQLYVARLGFGARIDEFIKAFQFPASYAPNVFHGALKNGVDVYIDDTGEEKIAPKIPDWYRKLSSAGSFVVFPITVNKRAVGLIYADHPRPKGMDLTGQRLNLLKALRNQIILAFRDQKH